MLNGHLSRATVLAGNAVLLINAVDDGESAHPTITTPPRACPVVPELLLHYGRSNGDVSGMVPATVATQKRVANAIR